MSGDVIYKVFRCEGGHQWDVFGEENEDGAFVPEDLRTYLCPTCDEVMVEEADPENLT
jgi:hypothetical protein